MVAGPGRRGERHPQRYDPFHPKDRPKDQRDPGARDRDRVLYTSALRRLAGVTQVVLAAEGHVFHNRLTHTLEAAQIARRLAQKLRADQPELAEELGGLDPEVVEAAALAHDLGHPPFGHVAESELDELARTEGCGDGFEGNAQSFRVITKLSIRHPEIEGLNLSRATLDATLKYPWRRETTGWRHDKFGAYHSEDDEFEFARAMHLPGDEARSVEAELMDWADDIAYAVHDVEDFHRARLIPLDRLISGNEGEISRFVKGTFARWRDERIKVKYTQRALQQSFCDVLDLVRQEPLMAPYEGTLQQRASLRTMTATLINLYVHSIKLRRPTKSNPYRVERDPNADRQIRMLKQLIWFYVIRNPQLATQQRGQRRIVERLFCDFLHSARGTKTLLPPSQRDLLIRWEKNRTDDEKDEARIRVALDAVCSMTEPQAIAMYNRLVGVVPGSVRDALT